MHTTRKKTNNNIRKITVAAATSEGILDFMDSLEKKKLFGYCLKDDEWQRRIEAWPKFKDSSVFVYEDAKGIRATCVPWSISPIKRMRAEKVKRIMTWSFGTGRLLGLPLPPEGSPLRIPYLTHPSFAEDTTLPETR